MDERISKDSTSPSAADTQKPSTANEALRAQRNKALDALLLQLDSATAFHSSPNAMMETTAFARATLEGREMVQRVLDRMRAGELLGVVWFYLIINIAPEFRDAVQDDHRGIVNRMRDDFVKMAGELGWFAPDTVGMTLFIGNILSIGYGGMWMAHRWKAEIQRDFNRVWKMSKITARDKQWLADNCPPDTFTIHELEGRWEKGEGQRRPPDPYVEFHDDESRVLFQIARQR